MNYIEYDVEVDPSGRFWRLNGKLSREGGPAVEYRNGDNMWYSYNKLHRLDGPAVEWSEHKKWLIFGELHREDGPAIECSSGENHWYLNDKKYSLEDWLKIVFKAQNNYTEYTVKVDEEEYWYKNGVLHRNDGPAVIDDDGTKFWYKNGKRHREDGFAIEWSDGRTGEYWLNDTNGSHSWWLSWIEIMNT